MGYNPAALKLSYSTYNDSKVMQDDCNVLLYMSEELYPKIYYA